MAPKSKPKLKNPHPSSPSPPLSPLSRLKAQLISTHQLLQLTHHRNKNQHRLSKWYKSFSQLRRSLSKLIAEVEALDIAEMYSSKDKGGENKYVKAAREKIESRVKFIRVWLVGRCYLAFSNLVADNQYSALGITLLGSLARVRSIMGLLVEEEEGAEGDVGGEEKIQGVGPGNGDDLGEVVSREEILGVREGGDDAEEGEVERKLSGEQEEDETQRPSMTKASERKEILEAATPSKPPKKKRKKGDAFDDLFSSLI